MFTPVLRKIALAACLGLTVAACANSNPPMQRFPQMTFSNLPAYNLDVGRIEVVAEKQSDGAPPHIEYDMPVSPENALKRWVQDRLRPVGRTGTLRVLIHDASATEVALKTDQGFTGLFKKEQAARVNMVLDVSLQMLDDHQMPVAEVSAHAERERTRPEGQKLNERDKLLYDMVEELMAAYNSQVDPNIGQNFHNWLGK
ncbi:MAG TPA: hypothetical protein VM661_15285 [Candidatus Sulfotelmatobacter sp.]|jgi:hypothetical protein|nr:hypothetical protein [Candidatus Sulfotelmatobacter sp.]